MSTAIDTVFSKEIAVLEAELHEKVSTFSLADAIRSGAGVTEKAENWGSEGHACAMTAAAIAIRATQKK